LEEDLFDFDSASIHIYDDDLTRTSSPVDPDAPTRQQLIDLRTVTRSRFPLSASHAALYSSFVQPSRSARAHYGRIVKERLAYTGMHDCGRWPEEYKRMHASVQGSGFQMGDPGAPKRVVHAALTRNGQNGGLGDRMLGQVRRSSQKGARSC